MTDLQTSAFQACCYLREVKEQLAVTRQEWDALDSETQRIWHEVAHTIGTLEQNILMSKGVREEDTFPGIGAT